MADSSNPGLVKTILSTNSINVRKSGYANATNRESKQCQVLEARETSVESLIYVRSHVPARFRYFSAGLDLSEDYVIRANRLAELRGLLLLRLGIQHDVVGTVTHLLELCVKLFLDQVIFQRLATELSPLVAVTQRIESWLRHRTILIRRTWSSAHPIRLRRITISTLLLVVMDIQLVRVRAWINVVQRGRRRRRVGRHFIRNKIRANISASQVHSVRGGHVIGLAVVVIYACVERSLRSIVVIVHKRTQPVIQVVVGIEGGTTAWKCE